MRRQNSPIILRHAFEPDVVHGVGAGVREDRIKACQRLNLVIIAGRLQGKPRSRGMTYVLHHEQHLRSVGSSVEHSIGIVH